MRASHMLETSAKGITTPSPPTTIIAPRAQHPEALPKEQLDKRVEAFLNSHLERLHDDANDAPPPKVDFEVVVSLASVLWSRLARVLQAHQASLTDSVSVV